MMDRSRVGIQRLREQDVGGNANEPVTWREDRGLDLVARQCGGDIRDLARMVLIARDERDRLAQDVEFALAELEGVGPADMDEYQRACFAVAVGALIKGLERPRLAGTWISRESEG